MISPDTPGHKPDKSAPDIESQARHLPRTLGGYICIHISQNVRVGDPDIFPGVRVSGSKVSSEF